MQETNEKIRTPGEARVEKSLAPLAASDSITRTSISAGLSQLDIVEHYTPMWEVSLFNGGMTMLVADSWKRKHLPGRSSFIHREKDLLLK